MKLEQLYDDSFFQGSFQSRARQAVVYLACSYLHEIAPELPTKDDIRFTARDAFYQLGVDYTRDQFESDFDALLNYSCIYRVTEDRFSPARPRGESDAE